MRKLKSLSFHCKDQNKKLFKKDVEQATNIDLQIAGVDALEESSLVSEADYNKQITLKVDLLNITVLEAIKWRQLCKFKWLMREMRIPLSSIKHVLLEEDSIISAIQIINWGNELFRCLHRLLL